MVIFNLYFLPSRARFSILDFLCIPKVDTIKNQFEKEHLFYGNHEVCERK